MFGYGDLLSLAVLGFVLWFWKDTLRARERALTASKRHCAELDVQLLDQGVSLARIGLGRDTDGRVKFKRHYRFEFSVYGDDRREGQITVLGTRILRIDLDLPEGRTITTDNVVTPLRPKG